LVCSIRTPVTVKKAAKEKRKRSNREAYTWGDPGERQNDPTILMEAESCASRTRLISHHWKVRSTARRRENEKRHANPL